MLLNKGDCCSGAWCSVIKAVDKANAMLTDCKWTVLAAKCNVAAMICTVVFSALSSYRQGERQEAAGDEGDERQDRNLRVN